MSKKSPANRAAKIIRRFSTVIPRPVFYLLATIFALAVTSAQLSSALTATQSSKSPAQPQAGAARRALELLLAMQDLPWAGPTAPTKAALVACDRTS